jgi:hypothetical protein
MAVATRMLLSNLLTMVTAEPHGQSAEDLVPINATGRDRLNKGTDLLFLGMGMTNPPHVPEIVTPGSFQAANGRLGMRFSHDCIFTHVTSIVEASPNSIDLAPIANSNCGTFSIQETGDIPLLVDLVDGTAPSPQKFLRVKINY